ncbi:MAG: RNA polymerase sigma factor [Vicinamibacterales bacterium]
MRDERSFNEFYSRTVSPLRAYVTRVLQNATVADDIVQESYLRFLKSAPATEDHDQLRAFLFRIAGNLMADYWRRQRFERPAEEPDEVRGTMSPENIPLRLDFRRAFAQLRPQQRAMMWLAYVEGAEHREIAGVLGLKERSIKVLLHRTRQQLAKLIRETGERQEHDHAKANM